MPSFNRRRFGQILVAAAALPLTAVPAQTVTSEKEGAVATPLTPAQMEQYRKALPDQSKQLDKLRSFDLGYGYEPDFIFRAVAPEHAQHGGDA